MLKEVSDYFDLLEYVHNSINKMIEGLSDKQWLEVDRHNNINNIASIIEHITVVEEKFMQLINGDQIDELPNQSFKKKEWNIEEIKLNWNKVLYKSKKVLENVSKEQLEEEIDLGIGTVFNKRQIIIMTISHLTHHRGQIPLVKKII
jgi:uncharacterized damage-inducible protein DinB